MNPPVKIESLLVGYSYLLTNSINCVTLNWVSYADLQEFH